MQAAANGVDIYHPYLRNKHKTKSCSCSNHNRTEQCSIAIDFSVEGVRSHNDGSFRNTRDVDYGHDEFGVVQSLHLDLADWEGKYHGYDLQQSLVTIEDAKEYVTGSRITNKNVVSGDNLLHL